MGIENIRRWPMYILFAVCVLLFLSLLNSWNLETELRNKFAEITLQLQQCSKQQSSCMEESLSLLEQRDGYVIKVNDLDKQKLKLTEDINEFKTKMSKFESRVNRTIMDVQLCQTELQSLKNLQVSKSATLETLRLEKDTLTSQLVEKKQKIEELEREIQKLRTSITTKSMANQPVIKVTPAAKIQKLSLNPPIQEPVLEDAAKEDVEDSNANNGNDFDPSIN